MNLYQQFIAKSRYARYLDKEKRREHWPETVSRYFDFMTEHLKERCNYDLSTELRSELEQAVLNLEVMPSMRLMMAAGPAVRRNHLCSYNCSFISIEDPKAFDELLFCLMCGTGVGFSVERQNTNKLPEVPEALFDSETTVVVSDSKEGWAKGLRQLIALLYSGEIPKWDLHKVRDAGSRLKTFGGRASGPRPLDDLFRFVVGIFRQAVGRKLTSLECHDLCCKIAEVVVVGGSRRCLPAGTLVDTSRGPVPVEEVLPGDKVRSLDGLMQEVQAVADTGVLPVWELHTNIGKFYSSEDHRWAVMEDPSKGTVSFKTVSELEATDRLVFIDSPVPSNSEVPDMPGFSYEKPKHSTTCKEVDMSSVSVEDWAWFLGLFHGDGYVFLTENKGRVMIAIPYDMPLTKLKVEKFFADLGLNSFVRTDEVKDRCWKITTCSKQLALYLSQFKKPKQDIHIPDFVKAAPVEIKAAYLAGVFDSDGSAKSCRKGRKSFRLVSTVYKSFVDQIKALAASLGIPCAYNCIDRSRLGWKDIYNLQVCGPDYKDKMASLLAPYSEKVNNDYNYCESKRDWFSLPLPLSRKLAQSEVNLGSTTSWNKLKGFSGAVHQVPVTLYGVKFSHHERCYDLQVANSECFTVSGLLTHNSALISLSNLSDERMRKAKSGEWWNSSPERSLANNSAVYTERPEVGVFMKEWLSLYESKSGERGIFNRKAAEKQAERTGRRKPNVGFGTNPCQPGWATVLTPEGIRRLDEVSEGSLIWSGKQWTRIAAKWSTGVKPVYDYVTGWGRFTGTSNHRVVQFGEKIEVRDAVCIDPSPDPRFMCAEFPTQNPITDVVYLGDHEVFDLTVEAEEHTYWTGGLLVSNCGEVVLRSQGLCNLTEVVCRPEDTELELTRKARLASILGTFQSTLTYFPYVRKGWTQNAEEERLLGVSLTGICDCEILNNPNDEGLPLRLRMIKDHVVHVNQEMADKLGINQSVATTVVKPSGTVSQLVQSSSGIHPAHARYYIRRVRNDNKDPLTQLLKDSGVPNEPCVLRGDTTTVFSFPMKTPQETLLRKDLSALDHFKLWLIYKQNYTEHNPSITISVREHEWPQVGAEVWKNFDEVLGVSFLPYNDKDHIYKQAPYEEISEEKYNEMASLMPYSIDWDSLVEEDDNVEGVQTLACTGGFCEI